MALNFPDSPTLNQIYTDTTSGFSYQWDGVVWQSYTAPASKNISILDDISGSFNGSTQTFALAVSGTALTPANAQQLRVVLGGIVQEPLTDYTVSGSDITFTTPPTGGLDCSIVSLGPAVSVSVPGDGTVTPVKLSTGGPSWNTSGLFGLGTSSPGAQLDIAGVSGTYPTQQIRHSAIETEGEFLRIARTDSSSIRYHSIVAKHSGSYAVGTNYIQFKIHNPSVSTTAQNTILHLDGTGKVAVGTTSPGRLLTMAGAEPIIRLQDTDFTNTWGEIAQLGAGLYIDSRQDTSNGAIIFRGLGGGVASERARIDSSGRLLVGTSSSSSIYGAESALQVAGTTYPTASISILRNSDTANDSASLYLGRRRTGGIVSAQDRIGLIAFAGHDGADLATPAASIDAYVDGTPGANDMPGRLVFSTTADGASSPTERMRITQDGSTLIGTTAPVNATTGTEDGFTAYSTGATHLSRSGAVSLWLRRRTSDGSIAAFYRDTTQVGTISITTTATAYNTSSDYRLKENVTAVTDGITRLQQLKPSRFNFIDDPTKTVDGFIAHEVQAIVPEAITGEKDAVDADGNPEYQGIDQSKLVPLLTAALQEAVAKIESLEDRLTAAGI